MPADNGVVLAQDVERILRDLLIHHGVSVSMLQVEPTSDGWRVTVTDSVQRVLTTEVFSNRPAALRAALTRWIEQEA